MFKGLFGSRSRRHYARGIEHFNAGHLEDAIAAFTEVLDGDDGGPDAALARFYRAEAHARLGAAALEAGDAAGALVHLDAAVEEHRHYPDLHIQRALALLQRDDALAAEQAARAALALNEGFVDAGVVLVVALSARGDTRRAAELAGVWARRAADAGSPLATALAGGDDLLTALIAHRQRRRQRRRIVEHAESCLRDGFWSEAAGNLVPLVAETPDYPDLRLRLAAARLGLGELPAARAELDAALAVNPRFADAHVLAGIVALRQDEVGRARTHFDAAAQIGRVPLVADYGRMLCDLRTGALGPALSRMNRLAGEEVPPDDARVLHAVLEALAGRAETALERFESLLGDLKTTTLLVDLVVWATGSAHHELAHAALQRVEDDDRTRTDVVRAHARLRAAEGALDRARGLLESALLNAPSDRELLVDLAGLLARMGDGAAGLRCLDAAAGGREADEGVLRGLRARLLRLEGRGDEAAALLDAVAPVEDAAAALERLYLLRAHDEGERARALYAGRADALDLAWRVQDPRRWLRPLRPWPDRTPPARPAS